MDSPNGANHELPEADSPPQRRFMTLRSVAEELATSEAQIYSLVRSGELPAIKVGGRGQWRVERQMLERLITQMYEQTSEFVNTHPFGEDNKYAAQRRKNPASPDE